MANPKAPARAFVLESNLDPGRGPVVTALVERGTLRVGEPVVAGGGWGKVRAMFDDHGRNVTEATPSMPVEILGLDDVPLAGDELRVAPNEKMARAVAEARAHRRHTANLAHPMSLAGGARLEDIFAMVQRGEVATLNLVLKADVQGSLEALTDALRKVDQGHEQVRLSFVHRAVGGITESDVNLAAVSNATVIGFNVRPDRKARELAEQEKVELRLYEVIYQVLEDVNTALLGLLSPSSKRWSRARPRCARSSRVPRVGQVAGCYVRNGVITAWLQGPVPARGRRDLERLDLVAEAVQGRRARGAERLRVRHRARELPRPQVGRPDRDLRPARDRPELAGGAQPLPPGRPARRGEHRPDTRPRRSARNMQAFASESGRLRAAGPTQQLSTASTAASETLALLSGVGSPDGSATSTKRSFSATTWPSLASSARSPIPSRFWSILVDLLAFT